MVRRPTFAAVAFVLAAAFASTPSAALVLTPHDINEAFVSDLYMRLLGRSRVADRASEGWVVMLDNGVPPAEVERMVRASTEAMRRAK